VSQGFMSRVSGQGWDLLRGGSIPQAPKYVVDGLVLGTSLGALKVEGLSLGAVLGAVLGLSLGAGLSLRAVLCVLTQEESPSSFASSLTHKSLFELSIDCSTGESVINTGTVPEVFYKQFYFTLPRCLTTPYLREHSTHARSPKGRRRMVRLYLGSLRRIVALGHRFLGPTPLASPFLGRIGVVLCVGELTWSSL
jgi:hypothetical protein